MKPSDHCIHFQGLAQDPNICFWWLYPGGSRCVPYCACPDRDVEQCEGQGLRLKSRADSDDDGEVD